MKIRERNARSALTLIEMGIVIMVIGILIGILGSMLSSVAFLKTSHDEAVILKDALVFCRRAAIKSNQVVYLEVNLTENYYRAYRYDRSGTELKEQEVLTKRELSGFNSIVGISPGVSARISSGKVTIPFTPDGVAQDLAVYIGSPGDIKSTVLFSRYGGEARVAPGEAEHNLEKPEWRENLENF